MEVKIFGGLIVNFSDEEIRSFLVKNGYTIIPGEILIRKNHPIKREKFKCDVAFSDVDKNPDYYISTFTRKMNYMGSDFIELLSSDLEIQNKLKQLILR